MGLPLKARFEVMAVGIKTTDGVKWFYILMLQFVAMVHCILFRYLYCCHKLIHSSHGSAFQAGQ